MHDYRTYELTHQNGKKSLFGACCKCGSIEIKNPTNEQQVCSEKMHKNCNVLALGMRIVPFGLLPENTGSKKQLELF